VRTRLATALLGLALALALLPACSRDSAPEKTHLHVDHPPHGGTVVALGDDASHIELVLDAQAGVLQAYVLDDEMEEFVRIAAPSIEIHATVDGSTRILVMAPVANTATGETVGNTSLFEGRAEWLRTANHFDGTLMSITVQGTTYTGVRFNFPKGNETGG
jgi:hypothetical protein